MEKIAMRVRLLALVLLIGLVVSLAVVFSPASVKAQYSGNENHVVTLDQAVKYIQNFKQNPVAPSMKGGYFGRNIFDKILAQGGVVGIRYYYAAKDDGTPTLVLVGVDRYRQRYGPGSAWRRNISVPAHLLTNESIE